MQDLKRWMGGVAAAVLLASCVPPDPYRASETEKRRPIVQPSAEAIARAGIQIYVGHDYWIQRQDRLLVCRQIDELGNCTLRSGHFRLEGFDRLTDSSVWLEVTFDGAPTGWAFLSPPRSMQDKFRTQQPSLDVTIYPSFLDQLPKKVADERRKLEGVAPGMDKGEVLTSAWGVPLSRKILSTHRGLREEWRYPHGNALYFRDGVLAGYKK